ncbi:Monocopper oxidase-like protein SKU5 [Dichanthelium oligosanthes]|uniref:Monocopper oxidase-like protein SKU5 n=1 Tax=Dichanthelium oligosanthes TaxID=888268 RepID=A0A1E5V0Y7_9POAL|nr:Monocopper oxidase-like protein SKU5 [Dichanthelium oligosanthes]
MAAVAPLLALAFMAAAAHAADPFAFFDWDVTYITASPLGVPQKVIAINKQFPGPVMNVTTNYNVVVNVLNSLDEPLLITWDGIQQRKNCWQDGVLGTTCPIPPGWNWTYNFQVKDQIGSFFYFPSLGMQRAAGGFGGITVNNRAVISVPFDTPDGDITLFIGDWYKKNHTALRKMLDDGKELGMPDGVLMNGKGPYRYNDSLVPDGIDYETIKVEPGKTYRIRVHNVGVSTSLNFRIQNHNLALVETEGSYTMKQNFTNLDIHKGVYTLDFPTMPIDGPPVIRTSVINSTFKNFLEIVFQNNDTIVQTYHIDGYAFWVVGMDYGEWSENSRGTYNKWDGVSRCTTQVFPGAWTAVMLSLDSPGFWNVRTENLDTWYLGQETYIRVVDPNGGYNVTEMVAPDNMLYCGLLKDKQKAQKPHGSSSSSASAIRSLTELK